MTHPVEELAKRIATWGGVAILVGGSVRDWIMAGTDSPFEVKNADYDIEVFGITLPKLKSVLWSNGYLFDEVGEQFSVLKTSLPSAGGYIPVDLSIPRYEKSTGTGHREFEVMAHPELTFKEAARRRDFTMNSLGFDPLSEELLDPYRGKIDIQTRVIHHVSDAFSEDPLRPLRAARFAARFDFIIDSKTIDLCQSMRPLANSLPSERIWMEVEKAVHESVKLGDFFSWIEWMDWIDLFPEVQALLDIKQDPEWHPEGDVFTHTVAALNYWSENLRTGNKEDDLVTAIAILCHDFGKVTNTQYDQKPGHITSHGHEEAGAEPTRTFLHRLRQHGLAEKVVPLVENHLAPVYNYPISAKAVRRLSTKVKRLDLLAAVSRADQAGRPPKDFSDGFKRIEQFEEKVAGLDIPQGGPKPLVGGDFLTSLGMTPGPGFGKILAAAYDYQIETGCYKSEAEEFVRREFFGDEEFG